MQAVGGLPAVVIRAEPPPWDRQALPATLQEWRDVDGHLVARGGKFHGRWFMDWPGLGAFVFGPAGHVDAHPLRGVEAALVRDIFVRGVLPTVMLGRGLECVHASAVISAGQVIAFSGESGVGKSTLALALAARGFEHWADDTVLLADAPDLPLSVSMPFPARVDESGRGAISLDPARYRKTVPEVTAPLARIYLPTRDTSLPASALSIVRVPPHVAFERVLPLVHPFELDGTTRDRRTVEHWLSFMRQVPVWELRFAPSLAALPDLAQQVAQHIAAA